MNIKSFVSEAQLDERRRKRQEEWEKTRRPDQPLEVPEEEYDPRSLYERLQANKIKKQEEYEESKRLKHLVRGLDNDEISFLELVDNTKLQEEILREKEEKEAIQEFKTALAQLSEKEQAVKLDEIKKSALIKLTNLEKKSSKRKNPLGSLIRRKSDLGKTNIKDKKFKIDQSQEKNKKDNSKIQASSLSALASYESDDSESELKDSGNNQVGKS